ncbi:hypothetical protein EST38_g8770 [Candolleomyces aberdarensis]|uniref:CAP-Gly domain-containing protein n=1 Tax=Candolleomyces aberdarensis TaxID=2316362 RepID=A0A4Q2DBT0_9AGAR|nr:hypothetical protein EST38_g8770 [Candolleomyces aberdarensis]
MSLVVPEAHQQFQHILRLLNTNVDGKRKIMYALTEIKGVGRRYSNLVCKKADVDLNKRAGELNSDELERIVTIIQNPTQFKIPTWFLNRQKDIVDGKNYQILSNSVDSKLREDLERLKKIRAHRGLRHFWGLRVRGQHTKTTGESRFILLVGRVGDNVRIESIGCEGALRFLGEIEGKPGQWAGVELSGGFTGKGKNNGSVGGVQYFKCSENCGVFVAASKLSPPTVGRPPSVASNRNNGRATPALPSGRITPSFSTSSYYATSRTPSASFANGRATPSASTTRMPSFNTPSLRSRSTTAAAAAKPKTPNAALSDKITEGSRAAKYMTMTAKDLNSSRGPKTKPVPVPLASSSPSSATSPKQPSRASSTASPTRGGSPFTTPKALTSNSKIGFGQGKGRPSGTPRARVPSGVAMPPPASPFSASRSQSVSLQDEDLPGDDLEDEDTQIFTGKLSYSRPGSSASFRSASRGDGGAAGLITQLQSRLDALEYENARLRAAGENAPPTVQPATETETQPVEPPPPQEDNGELDQLKAKHEEALQKISLLEKELDDSKVLQATKETEIGALKQDLEKSGKEREEEKASDAAAMASLRAELEDASKESQGLQKVCEEREALLAEVEGNLQAKEGEIQSLKDSLASTTLELEEERKELGLQIEELRTAGQETIALYEERLSQLEGQRYDLQTTLDSLKERGSARSPSPAGARTHTSNPSAAEIDNETLTEQVQHLQRKILGMEEDMEEAQANAEKEKGELFERMKRLKDREESVRKELAEAKKELDKSAREKDEASAKLDETEVALEDSKYRLEEARVETERLRNDMANLDNLIEGGGDTDDLSTRVVAYTRRIASEREQNLREIARLGELLQDAEASPPGSDVQGLQDEIARLQALNQDLERDLVRVRVEVEERDRDLKEMKKKLRDVPVVNGTLDTSKSPSSKDGAKEELAGMKHIVQELQKENSVALHKIKLLESENQLLKSETEQLRQEVSILEENLDKSLTHEENGINDSNLSDDVVSLQRKIKEQSTELEQLRKKLSELEMKHARTAHDLNKEISELEALVESKIYREDELEQEIERLKEKVSRYKKSSKTPAETASTNRLSTSSLSSVEVAAHNAPPPENQPRPDPALLTTETPTSSTTIDSTSKLNIVAPDFKLHPHTDVEQIPADDETHERFPVGGGKAPNKKRKREEALSLWQQVSETVMRPQVAGGLLGIVNVGLIAGAGYAFYAKPHLRTSTKAITTSVSAALVLIFAEGSVAEQYSHTPEGQRAIRRVRESRHWLVNYLHDFAARTNPTKGAIGILNTLVLGGVGYLGYANRDRPWDRRAVSSIAAGLLALAGAEG